MIITRVSSLFVSNHPHPESFFSSMLELSESGCDFHISVLGEQFTDVPGQFNELI
jgi:hypothetical protein